MTTVAESSDADPISPHGNHPTSKNFNFLDAATPYIDYVVQQTQLYQKTFNDTVESTLQASKSRLSQIRSTSSAHFHQTKDSLDDLKSQYNAYEALLFGKIKEGVLVAASHPMIICAGTAGLELVVLKNVLFTSNLLTCRASRFLYRNSLRLLVSEETIIARADAELKELRQSIDLMKLESEKLEKGALHAEEEFLRGRNKLRQAGKQIRSMINSAYKIERRAEGLKDILRELPGREASHFRSQVSKLASEAKREKNALTKEVSEISNYGISV